MNSPETKKPADRAGGQSTITIQTISRAIAPQGPSLATNAQRSRLQQWNPGKPSAPWLG
jgi:hypothetical protein